jgi:hypothetical protein
MFAVLLGKGVTRLDEIAKEIQALQMRAFEQDKSQQLFSIVLIQPVERKAQAIHRSIVLHASEKQIYGHFSLKVDTLHIQIRYRA